MKVFSTLIILMSVIVSFHSHSYADTLPFLTGKEAGMDVNQLRHIELAVGKHVDKKELAGAVTLVLRKGGIVHLEAHGWKDLASRAPMTTDTIFRIFSMTKPVVSTGVMMLIEEGKIGLDAPVETYLPQLKGLKVLENGERVTANRAPTVRDLLRHTAGLTYGFFGDSAVDKLYAKAGILANSNDTATFLQKVGSLPLAYQPGEKWVYSISVDVQGALIEEVSGLSLDRFLKQKILEPLGMQDTGFYVPIEKRNRFASLYTKGQIAMEKNEESDYRFPPRFFSGGGGMVSTALDYAKFLQMLINGGELAGVRLLKKETVQNMTRNHLEGTAFPIGINDNRDGFGFGLGFNIVTAKSDYDKDARVGEYGWGGMASTHFWVSPEDELAVITMEQTIPYTWNLERSIKGLVYKAIIE